MITTMNDLRIYLSKGELNCDDTLSIITILRIQIEIDDKKNNYRWLKLFANWCVHSKISKSDLAIDILKTFYDVLGNYDFTQGQSPKDFYDHIFDKLRTEMSNIFRQHNMPSGLVDNERTFCEFLIGILMIIKDRPIRLPEKPSKIQQKKIAQLPKLLKFANNRNDIDFTPISLCIKHTENGAFNCVLTTEGIKGGRLIFDLSTIGYKNKALSFLVAT